MTNIPIDIPLPLPAPDAVLKALLVITFIIHILFVGLMVGGTYWSVIFRVLGKEDPFYERLARETLDTVTINKSLAVVLGVAPLLLIGLAYTGYWYTANMMTVPAFLSIIWLVILAFLLLYAYKYTWDGLGERAPLIHLSLGLSACAIFAFVPLIFLTNINLMILPFRWDSTEGFVQALLLPNVLFRYIHFLVAVFAMIGFFAAIYFWYRGRKSDDPFYCRAQRLGVKWALAGTLLQGIFGTLNFITLPQGAYSTTLVIHIVAALVLVAAVCIALIRALQKTSGRPIIAAVVLLGIVALLMSFVRHVVRENLLREPQTVAAQRTQEYQASLAAFLATYTVEGERVLSGEELFKRYCTSCHAPDRQLVGPPTQYMIEKYTGKKEDMVAFVMNPKKVNPKLPAMPTPPIGKDEIEQIVEHILGEANDVR
ncbi:MAG: c-type cytochrome [Candidatus Lindowbacteria bacterium]|nr:c-type cytochrome [Candidatus Lindowbacteria bacterium]